jgi:hypothetical protein
MPEIFNKYKLSEKVLPFCTILGSFFRCKHLIWIVERFEKENFGWLNFADSKSEIMHRGTAELIYSWTL